jgi:DNA primase
LRKGTPLHLYLQGPHEGIWNADALNKGELILCEAPFDALTFWVNGFKNVTFIYGTEGFTDELFHALLARRVRRVRIAYDADDAGNRAAARDAERLAAHGMARLETATPDTSVNLATLPSRASGAAVLGEVIAV